MSHNYLRVLRALNAASIIGICLSVKYASKIRNNPNNEYFIYALTESVSFKIALAASIAMAIPLVIDMVLDSIFYYKGDKHLSERLYFAMSLLLLSMTPLAYSNSIYISQVYVAVNNVQNMVLVYCTFAVMHKLKTKIWTGPRILLIYTLYAFQQIITAYYLNSPDKDSIHLVENLDILVYVVFSGWIIMGVLSSWKIYKMYQVTRKLRNNDMVALLYTWAPAVYWICLFALITATNSAVLTSRGVSELTGSVYIQMLLTLIMVVIPSRMVRYEIVHVEHALEAKKEIARHVYHEMRTPLNIVVIGLELLTNALRQNKSTNPQVVSGSQSLIQREAEEDIEDIVNNISISCKSTVEILNDMLAYEKMESGLYSIECRYCPVISLVRDIVLPFQLHARQKNISLKLLDKIQNDQLCIYADSIKMGQVIRNLLSNALKFTPQDGTVTVVMEVVTSDGKPLGLNNSVSFPTGQTVTIESQEIVEMKPIIRQFYDAVTDPSEMCEWCKRVGARFNKYASILPQYSSDDLTAHQSINSSSVPKPCNNYVPYSIGARKSRKRTSFGSWMNGSSVDTSVAAGPSHIRISVMDTGVGMIPSNLSKLFNEVVQFDSNTLQVSRIIMLHMNDSIICNVGWRWFSVWLEDNERHSRITSWSSGGGV